MSKRDKWLAAIISVPVALLGLSFSVTDAFFRERLGVMLVFIALELVALVHVNLKLKRMFQQMEEDRKDNDLPR